VGKEVSELLRDIYDSAKETAIEFWARTGPKWLPKAISKIGAVVGFLANPKVLDDPEYRSQFSTELWKDQPPPRRQPELRQGR
jgi:hypothetical protein